MPDQCGAITIPIARSTPSARICAIVVRDERLGVFHAQVSAERIVAPRVRVQPFHDAFGLRAGRIEQGEDVADRGVSIP